MALIVSFDSLEERASTSFFAEEDRRLLLSLTSAIETSGMTKSFLVWPHAGVGTERDEHFRSSIFRL